jgi:TetR/AcrR family transcriptional regulator, lmrAB and yxaGH operons repressor
MAGPGDSRDRMLRAAVELFRERGYAATSFSDVIERSGAPRGSIYHHFPGGKLQLGVEALRFSAERTGRALERAASGGGSSVDSVRFFFRAMRELVVASGYEAGCAVAGVVLDTSPDDAPLVEAAREAFDAWRRGLARAFEADGAGAAQARRLAAFVVAAAEGALVLARAERGVRSFDDVSREVEEHLRRSLSGVRAGGDEDD